MNFQSIQYFLQTAKRKSFSLAAQDLYITQQTLSASVASLEKELGCRLFVRHVPLELTYAGEVFLRHAMALQENYERMERDFKALRSGERSRLRVGVTANRGWMIMPPLIQAFRREHPLAEIEVFEKHNDDLLESLYEGRIDLVIASFFGMTRGIVTEDFFEDEIVLAVPKSLLKDIPEADRQEKEDEGFFLLKKLPLLMSSSRSASGQIARDLIRQSGIVPEINVRSGNMNTIIELCARGEGICFCPERVLKTMLTEDQTEELKLVRFPEHDTRYMIRFGYLAGDTPWQLRNEFMETARAVFAPAGKKEPDKTEENT